MSEMLRTITKSKWFQNGVTVAILAAGLLAGIETYEAFSQRYHGILSVLDQIVLWIFVAEVVVKMGAEGRRPWRYFYDPWNVFDFTIVAVCFLPIDAQYAMVARLIRLLRVLKLVTAVPRLQILVNALLKSIPSMAYVSILLVLLFYVYGVGATVLFSENDPIHFADLQTAMVSLFRTVTLEDWTDIMYIQMYGCAGYGYGSHPELCTASTAFPILSPVFFISFVLIGTMIFMNLFVGVILNGMDESQKEIQASQMVRDGEGISVEIGRLREQLATAQEQLDRVRAIADAMDRSAK